MLQFIIYCKSWCYTYGCLQLTHKHVHIHTYAWPWHATPWSTAQDWVSSKVNVNEQLYSVVSSPVQLTALICTEVSSLRSLPLAAIAPVCMISNDTLLQCSYNSVWKLHVMLVHAASGHTYIENTISSTITTCSCSLSFIQSLSYYGHHLRVSKQASISRYWQGFLKATSNKQPNDCVALALDCVLLPQYQVGLSNFSYESQVQVQVAVLALILWCYWFGSLKPRLSFSRFVIRDFSPIRWDKIQNGNPNL